MTIGFSSTGSFDNTEKWLKSVADGSIFKALEHYGQEGVDALRGMTPVESGLTANSWSYEIVQDASSWSIIWDNSHVEDGVNIAVILQYGHGTGWGGYVQGRDYINPALQPIFDQIVADAWKAVTS